MAEHISALTMPNDVELVIEQIRPKLRQQYNFAKSKDMPLTDKEHAGPGSNVHETSKQYNTQRFSKRNSKRRTQSFLNVDLRTKTLGRGHCWWCLDKGHNLFECSQAKAVAEENTRKGKNFDDTNREEVRKFKAKDADVDVDVDVDADVDMDAAMDVDMMDSGALCDMFDSVMDFNMVDIAMDVDM